MDRFRTFRALHESQEMFVIPNPWDPGTAKLFESFGFKALATTSAGFAFSRGKADGMVPFDDMLQHCREMVAATSLPVSADLEKGMGDSPQSAAETIGAAADAGLAGCSIEDHTGDVDRPIYDFDVAVERVAAAAEAVRALRRPFVFTARAENHLWGRADIDDTIKRLQAFQEAGADVLYAPGLNDIQSVREVCSALSRPVNVLAKPVFSLDQLAAEGVRRVSLGSGLVTYVFGMLDETMRSMRDLGSLAFLESSMPFGDLQLLFAGNGSPSSR